MTAPLQLIDTTPQMPYVRFKRVAVEDKEATLKAGHYVAKDVDFVMISRAGSRDIFEQKVESFFTQCRQDVKTKRLPIEWFERYQQIYNAFTKGQDLPLDGTPIKGWAIISPAQQETLVRLNVFTVEQLSAIDSDVISRIGIGGLDLKNKAIAWLKQIDQAGSVSLENAELKKENASLKRAVKKLEDKLKELESHLVSVTANDAPATD